MLPNSLHSYTTWSMLNKFALNHYSISSKIRYISNKKRQYHACANLAFSYARYIVIEPSTIYKKQQLCIHINLPLTISTFVHFHRKPNLRHGHAFMFFFYGMQFLLPMFQ